MGCYVRAPAWGYWLPSTLSSYSLPTVSVPWRPLKTIKNTHIKSDGAYLTVLHYIIHILFCACFFIPVTQYNHHNPGNSTSYIPVAINFLALKKKTIALTLPDTCCPDLYYRHTFCAMKHSTWVIYTTCNYSPKLFMLLFAPLGFCTLNPTSETRVCYGKECFLSRIPT